MNQEKEKPGPKPKSPYSKFDAPSTTLVLLKLSKVHSPFQELVKYYRPVKHPVGQWRGLRICISNKLGGGDGGSRCRSRDYTLPDKALSEGNEGTHGALNFQNPQLSSAGNPDTCSDGAQVCSSPTRQPLEAAPESPRGKPCPHSCGAQQGPLAVSTPCFRSRSRAPSQFCDVTVNTSPVTSPVQTPGENSRASRPARGRGRAPTLPERGRGAPKHSRHREPDAISGVQLIVGDNKATTPLGEAGQTCPRRRLMTQD